MDSAALLREGAGHHHAGRLAEAEACYARVLAVQPGQVDALHLSGVVCLQTGRFAPAVELIGAALARNPRFADAHANLGHALRLLGRADEALAAYGRALALDGRQVQALIGRAALRRDRGDFAGAAEDGAAALALAPGAIPAGQPAADRARICDWSRRDEDIAGIVADLAAGRAPPSPLVVLGLIDDPALHRRLGELIAPPALPAPALAGSGAGGGPVRVGFLSGECGDTATWRLAVEAVERLDRAVVEPVGIGWGPPRAGAMRERVEQAFAAFHDGAGLDDAALVDLARGLELDVAVDMGGYTRWARPGLIAARVAPVQVNWLAYPGTMGSDYHDYILADQVVVPEGSAPFFSEAVVRLPHCYQPNDSGRAVAEPPSRAEAGLPERGFVLACFNQPYKIAPDLFALWMDLLRQVPGSVLWLIEALPQASANLKAAARRAGIAPERLVLAPPLPLPEHLARHALADLALDTTGYTGHTTTSDALWAGLPVITCRGRAMPARVAASLLGAAGLDDCIADDLPGYAALALSLARDPARLADLRARCAAARQSPLFDSAGYADALGRAFAEMDRRRRAGQAPAGFTVPV